MEVDPRRAARRRSFLRARKYRELYPPADFGKVYIPRGGSRALGLDVGDSWATATDAQKAQRRQHHYYGPGKYSLKAFGRGLKRAAAGVGKVALAEAKRRAISALTGGGLYTGAQGYGLYTGVQGYGMYTGSGAYSNDLVQGGAGSSVATVASASDETGAVIIGHKEYIGDIYANPSGAPFINQQFSLNPGLEMTFPWLSQLAQNYEEYEFRQLLFTYKSVVADVSSANGQVGTVIMATNYNASQPAWTDKSEMMTYAHSSSSKTSETMIHGVECDPRKLSGDPGKYTRTRPVVVGEDIKSYDYGTFQIAVANTPSSMANSTIGELWVSYTIVLRKPKISSGKGEGISRFLAVTPKDGTINNVRPFGVTDTSLAEGRTIFAQQNSLPLLLVSTQAVKGFGLMGVTEANIHNGAGGPGSRSAVAMTQSPLGVVIPGSYAGVLRVVITVEGVWNPTAAGQTVCLCPPAFQGNIRHFTDMYGSSVPNADGTAVDADSDNPSWFTSIPHFSSAAASARRFSVTSIMHIRVEPAANSLNNVFLWGPLNTEGFAQGKAILTHSVPALTVQQAQIDVSEYNASFATSNYVDNPIFVDLSGQVQAAS